MTGVWAEKVREMKWDEFLEEWNGQGVFGGEGGLPGRGDLESRREAVARSFCDWSLGRQEDLRAGLAEVKCPVMWLAGVEDEKFYGLAAEGAAASADGLFKGIKRAGHRVPWKAQEVFLEEVENFFARV